MSIIIALVLIAIGITILIMGAEALVKGASAVASRFDISPLVIGLTIVAFGTSMPELTVNLYAAATGATDIAIGNVVGSNIANILLVLGAAAMVTRLSVKSSTVRWEIPLALLASLLVFTMGHDILLDGGAADVLTRTDGLALLGFFVIFLFYVVALVRAEPGSVEAEVAPALPVWKSALYILAGLTGLVIGGRVLVDQAVVLAELAGLSEAVIGLTVVAVGTSLPELATSVVAAMRKQVDIAVGNVVGSNIFNIFWILGVTATIAPLPVPASFTTDALMVVGATLLLFGALFVGTKGHLDRWQGALMILVYVGYVATLLI